MVSSFSQLSSKAPFHAPSLYPRHRGPYIDHGKSTLVKALTGTDPDRLPEEKERGMTIELGFAHFDVADPEQPEVIYSLGVVDVPGMPRLIRNMLAGVTAVDIALFIVAADDGWMPQSEEHLQILTHLGIHRAVIALTKSDLAEDLDFAVELLREEVRQTILEGTPIVPVSVPHGRGLEALRQAIATALRHAPGPPDIGKPRLHIDRAFSPTGVGTVVTGTLTGGSLAGGAEVMIQPWGGPADVRGVQSHRTQKDHARPGMRTAPTPHVPLAGRKKIRRASWRCGDSGQTRWLLGDARCVAERSARPVPGQPGCSRPLRSGRRVRVHHGSATHEARLHFLGRKSLGPGECILAEFAVDDPDARVRGRSIDPARLVEAIHHRRWPGARS